MVVMTMITNKVHIYTLVSAKVFEEQRQWALRQSEHLGGGLIMYVS